jgi:spore coat polysaccharide biosynthesis protein SpsF
MLKTLGVVEACCASASDRAKMARRLEGKSVVEWVARRCTECLHLDGVIVVTRDLPENAFLSCLVPRDVPLFMGRQADHLGCVAAALEEYPAEALVWIRGDCLFVDPLLLDRLVLAAGVHPELDYLGFTSRDGQPATLSPVGVYGEWLRATALHKAARRAVEPADRQHLSRYVFSRPEKFNVRLLPAPAPIDRDDVRLTVDIEEDWDHAQTIFEALGSEELNWQRIADLLHHQPAMRHRMAALNRQHARV